MSGQSKTSSFVESLANIVTGMGISFALCHWLLHAPLATNAALTVLLTFVSLARQFVLRRIFNKLTTRKIALAHEYIGREVCALAARKTRAPWCNVTPPDGRCK